jgi:hypothetical protein
MDWQLATSATSASFTGQEYHTYFFRARARDNAGNMSTYSSGDAQTTIDLTAPPAALLSINGGALTSPSTSVTLILTTNASAPPATRGTTLTRRTSGTISDMSFSNDGISWAPWQPFAGSTAWTLTPGDSAKTVYGRFKDGAGNVSAVVSDTILLDTTVPANYSVSINDGALYTNQVSVTLKIGALSGTARMMVSNDGGFEGRQWEPYASYKAWTITQYGSYVVPRVVYLRYGDAEGNVLNTSTDDILLDVTAPTGSVSILSPSGSRTTASTVTLALSAVDDVSGVGRMMLSNRMDFIGGTWQAYTTSAAWTLDANNTVYVRFRDNAGNVSQTYSASRGSSGYLFLPVILR